jgi:hypothetical protein
MLMTRTNVCTKAPCGLVSGIDAGLPLGTPSLPDDSDSMQVERSGKGEIQALHMLK